MGGGEDRLSVGHTHGSTGSASWQVCQGNCRGGLKFFFFFFSFFSGERLAAPSTMASTVDANRVAARFAEVEKKFDRLVEVHADLRDAVQNCNLGNILGYQELESKEMDEYLQQLQEEVEDLNDRTAP